MASLSENSGAFGVLAYTIQAGPVAGYLGSTGTTDGAGAAIFTHKYVTSCYVQQYSGTQVYMNFGRAATAAATSWKLSTSPIPVPIDDLAKLSFIGTASDIVQIMYRAA